jgi:cobalt-zinc-cadmium efflux system protein
MSEEKHDHHHQSHAPHPHHTHSHAGGHHHHHSHFDYESVGRMKFAFVLNFSFAIIELIGGFMTNSVAILSDALHDFGDAVAMVIAIIMEKMSHKTSDDHFSYGYRRFSTLGAVITGLILVLGSLFILIEAAPRLIHPQQPETTGMIWLAVFGVAVNGFAALRVSKGNSLNERMLMWHMIEDVLGWVLVLVGAIAMKFWNIPQLDAGLAIILSLWILYNVFRNLREAFRVFLMAAPISADAVIAKIKTVKMVEDVHHAHVWSLDGEHHIFSAHVVVIPSATLGDIENIKCQVKDMMKEFGIIEATIETELSGTACADPSHG